MDTISLFQAGFTNVVASMGTSLTKEQARLAKRYAENAYISYDGDFAGQKGAVRGLEILRDEGINVRVVPLPEGLDPDDVVKRQGSEGYRCCLDAAMPLIDFKLEVVRRKHDLTKTEGKRACIAESLKVIAEAESESVKEDLLKQLRDSTGVTYESLKRDLQSAEEGVPRPESPDPAFILASVLFGAKYAKKFDLSGVRFDDPVHNKIANYIRERQEKGEQPRASALFDIFSPDTPELSAVLDLSLGDSLVGAATDFVYCLPTVERARLQEEMNRLSRLCDAETDVARKREMTRSLLSLAVKLKNL